MNLLCIWQAYSEYQFQNMLTALFCNTIKFQLPLSGETSQGSALPSEEIQAWIYLAKA